jgi:hypothetical protein
MIVYISTTSWTSVIIKDFSRIILYILVNFWQSIILCPFKSQMWHAYEDVFYGFELYCATSMATTMVCSFFLHVSTLWLVIPQFVQYLWVFHVLFCVFGGATYLVFYGILSALLAAIIIIPSSHNITASLCNYIVDHFIPAIVILRYDCKLALNTIVKKLSMVGTYKPWANFWIHS